LADGFVATKRARGDGGGVGEFSVEQDKQHRTLGFAQEVEAEIARSSAGTRAVLEAYARGVNAYIASLDAKSLPTEFQILQYKPKPWTPADSLLVGKLFAEALSNTWRLDIMRNAYAELPAEKRAGLMPEISPLDVLVVGKDSRDKTKKASSSQPANDSRERVSIETLLALAHDQQVAEQSTGARRSLRRRIGRKQ